MTKFLKILLISIFVMPLIYFGSGLVMGIYNVVVIGSIIDSSTKINSCYLKHFGKVYYYKTEVFSTLKKLKADPGTFTLLANDYCIAKDVNSVYYKDKIVEGVDVETFSRLNIYDNSDYFTDKNYVYYWTRKLEGMDPKKFKIWPNKLCGDGVKFVNCSSGL